MDIILVRHATSVRASIGIWGRRFDAPLAPRYEEQLRTTREALRSLSDYTLYSSPLLRCTQTAQHLFPNDPVHVISELAAYHSGILETMTEADVVASYPGYLALSFHERFSQPRFGEESIDEQSQRVATGFLRILKECQRSVAIIVAHYSSINIMAHLAAQNWDSSRYGVGAYDLEDGEYFAVSVARQEVLSHFNWTTPADAGEKGAQQ